MNKSEGSDQRFLMWDHCSDGNNPTLRFTLIDQSETHGASMFATEASAELAAVLHDPAAGPIVPLSWSLLCTVPVLLILWVWTKALICHMLIDKFIGHMLLHAYQMSWELFRQSSDDEHKPQVSWFLQFCEESVFKGDRQNRNNAVQHCKAW